MSLGFANSERPCSCRGNFFLLPPVHNDRYMCFRALKAR
jgi:hypothetical protein